ncbi:transport protein particle component [Fomitiporia mediterranea MF3/22]|uniref:transport protein particle component n=1 Tax=Fomitiporia mediterranea (strain MF3/22) TaxID=694068 RepID=UPI00044076EE|nr:transport protein particle component [Fomitiporia mediterranea MF3/22]EJD04562.1 transport protein particle component [Fomitiporia mediterranea MF3/22]
MALRSSLQSPAYTSTAASSSSLVTPSLSLLADPPVRLADAAALDYLVIEMVHALRASASVATERVKRVERELLDAGLGPAPAPPEKSVTLKEKERLKKDGRESVGSTRTRVSSLAGQCYGLDTSMSEAEEDEESLRLRLEAIGVHVGGNVAERLCRERPRFGDTLDAIKFICKDVWSTCWDKQVDNLRTNHRGVYVLQDNQFKPISRISSYEGTADAIRRAKIYVALPVGIIRGALARMGYHATVVPEIQHIPACTFQIKLPRS